jgi:hypothetical protein
MSFEKFRKLTDECDSGASESGSAVRANTNQVYASNITAINTPSVDRANADKIRRETKAPAPNAPKADINGCSSVEMDGY